MNKAIVSQFYVHEAVVAEKGATIIGRCAEGDPIRVGDVFTSAYHVRLVEEMVDGEVDTKTELYDPLPVCLTVSDIYYYGGSRDELFHGLTARLVLAGSGIGALKGGVLLAIEK